ncbi:MAG: hypothetical protein VX834_12240 [Myxococcota bacterium]|nr:hypothetical protein [Myxococcota bacterium]
MHPITHKFMVLWLALSLGTACTTEDTGRACEASSTAIGLEPIVGEEAIAELANLGRDETCQSLQCLSESGLPAYCTRGCELAELPSSSTSCSTDVDCASPSYCLDGACRDDDCPAGFWCRSPFDVGPLSGTPLCVRRKGCSSNIDCEGLGRISCVALGCVDSCLLSPETCSEHTLVCQDRENLPCSCPEELGETCTTSELECTLPGESAALDPEAVTHRSICIQDQPPS